MGLPLFIDLNRADFEFIYSTFVLIAKSDICSDCATKAGGFMIINTAAFVMACLPVMPDLAPAESGAGLGLGGGAPPGLKIGEGC